MIIKDVDGNVITEADIYHVVARGRMNGETRVSLAGMVMALDLPTDSVKAFTAVLNTMKDEGRLRWTRGRGWDLTDWKPESEIP